MSSEKYEIGTRAECEKMVKQWGFSHVFTWTDSRYVTPFSFPFWDVSLVQARARMANSERSKYMEDSGAYYPPHSHSGKTTHLIRRGTLTITYPEENAVLHNGEIKKETFVVGDRVDVPAGKIHEVWIGSEGCEYVIGE